MSNMHCSIVIMLKLNMFHVTLLHVIILTKIMQSVKICPRTRIRMALKKENILFVDFCVFQIFLVGDGINVTDDCIHIFILK
jgi:hypothetical protein